MSIIPATTEEEEDHGLRLALGKKHKTLSKKGN
jgi:hypothetical protein